jgi:hypothetical protein
MDHDILPDMGRMTARLSWAARTGHSGSDEGGRRAAAIYTCIQTAKLNDVDPQAWLADLFARLQDQVASTSYCRGIGSGKRAEKAAV